jgi:hypothetical protein
VFAKRRATSSGAEGRIIVGETVWFQVEELGADSSWRPLVSSNRFSAALAYFTRVGLLRKRIKLVFR